VKTRKYQPKMPSGQYYSKSKSGASRNYLDRLTYDVMPKPLLEHHDLMSKRKFHREKAKRNKL